MRTIHASSYPIILPRQPIKTTPSFLAALSTSEYSLVKQVHATELETVDLTGVVRGQHDLVAPILLNYSNKLIILPVPILLDTIISKVNNDYMMITSDSHTARPFESRIIRVNGWDKCSFSKPKDLNIITILLWAGGNDEILSIYHHASIPPSTYVTEFEHV